MQIRLEDAYEDIIGKAQSGLGLSDLELMEKSALSMLEIEAAKEGRFDEAAARQLAFALNLNADALVAIGSGSWSPREVEVDGFLLFNTPHPVPGYEEMTVNAFLVWDEKSRRAVAFDSGAKARPMIDVIRAEKLKLHKILLTHGHPDHIKGLDDLRELQDPGIRAHPDEEVRTADPIRPGDTVELDGLSIETRLTPGHSPGGLTFFVTGLERPIAIVGDAIFAGSIGGVRGDYKRALDAIREEIFSLPDDTVIAPGHGPLTTVGEQKKFNPFFPEFAD